MGVITHRGTYQGYPIKSVRFKRSEGIAPEFGSVVLNLEDVKQFRVFTHPVPWRDANGFAFNGNLSIRAWRKIEDIVASASRAELKEELHPPKGGLNDRGDLVLQSFDDGIPISGGPTSSMIYKDIFIDTGGIEETTNDLAEVALHKKGEIIVPLVDLRAFWKDYGGVHQRINATLRSGKLDPATVKDFAKLKPWSFLEVLQFILRMLPGSPGIVNIKQIESFRFSPPRDVLIEGGSPAIGALARLLEESGLVLKLQPDNNVAIQKKTATKLNPGQIPVGFGVSPTEPEDGLVYQRRTVRLAQRPFCVQVFGKPIIRRITLAYVPVIQDIDGRWYRLIDIPALWGYRLALLNRQVLAGHEKNFENVPPVTTINIPFTGGIARIGSRVHQRRKEILREQAYRVYAPSILFDTKIQGAGAAGVVGGIIGTKLPSSSLVIPSLSDSDFERLEFLPVREAPWYASQLRNENVSIPHDDGQIAGDRETFRLMPPIIRARRVRQEFFTDFAAVERYFKGLDGLFRDDIAQTINEKDKIQKQIQDLLKDAAIAEEKARDSFVRRHLDDDEAKSFPTDVFEIDLDFDTQIVRSGGSATFINGKKQQKIMSDEAFNALATARVLSRTAETYAAMIDVTQRTRAKWKAEFEKFRTIYENLGGIQVITNSPVQVMEEGAASIEPTTGIVTFADKACLMKQPFILEGDTGEVVADGMVTVTFGYELKRNETGDLTSVLLAVKPTNVFLGGEKSILPLDVRVVGYNRSSGTKPFVIANKTMRMYQEENGTPMNLTEITQEAYSHAKPVLDVPSTAIGYEDEWDSFKKAVLDDSVTSIHHSWEGDDARTHIFVNAPNSRGGLGAAKIGQETRSAIQSLPFKVQEIVHGESD